MLNAQQSAFLEAIDHLDLEQVKRLLAEGLDPNFIDPERGPAVSVWSDGLFKWWENVSEAYEAGEALSTEQKQQDLQVHLDILDALIGDSTEANQSEYQITQRDENSWLMDGQYSYFEFWLS